MSFSVGEVSAIVLGYLSLLFAVALATDRGWAPARLVRHPVVYTLSLGVYASVWTFYGAVGLANTYGYSFLASYFGASAAFILGPVLLRPLLRLTQSYQLSSVADLFAFRFRSPAAGAIVTVLMLIASLPLFAIQIQAVSDTFTMLTQDVTPGEASLLFCLVIALFAILFGARHPSIRHKHEGLVMAMALESLIKLAALLLIAGWSLHTVFGGNAGLQQWLTENSTLLSGQAQPVTSDYWRTLLLAFFTSAIIMPHMFHMLFTENISPRGLERASWGFPLLLLLLAISIPPILWAGLKLDLPGSPEYFALALGMHAGSGLLTAIAFVGGLAAASGIIVVATIALAGMVINHLLLPVVPGHRDLPLYKGLVWAKRAVILLITLLSYGFHLLSSHIAELHQLGLIAFIAFLQFLPGYLATLFWPGGTRLGFIAGLLTGMTIWLLAMLAPLLPQGEAYSYLLELGGEHWHRAAVYSLGANLGVFILLSSIFRPSPQELYAANSCTFNALHRPQSEPLYGLTPGQLIERLTPRLGREAAEREVLQAAEELAIPPDCREHRQLIRLQQRLETNLSALIGPVEALAVLSEPEGSGEGYQRRDIRLLESHLERYRDRLTGLAAELDALRAYHRLTLERIPVGVCALGQDGAIVLWNAAMHDCSGLSADAVLGLKIADLPNPWRELLEQIIESESPHLPSLRLSIDGQPRWFNLHRAELSEGQGQPSGLVLLLEDRTETQLLSEELTHSERLASIGRLAAGVAHEIGNPVTAIACLAQNLIAESSDQAVVGEARQILAQTERIDRIIRSLTSFAHAGDSRAAAEPVQLHDCVAEAIELLRLDRRRKEIRYLNECPPGLQVTGDHQRLLQVMVNLLTNAADASEPGQSVRISARAEEHRARVEVTDEGCGIPAELQSRIFDPFFTTKEPGQGTGLGLALVHSIVEEHYGSLRIESPADSLQNRGTRVVLTLPLAPRQTGS